MQLQYISREQYRHKTDRRFIDSLEQQYGRFYLIPEGGSNSLALAGCREMVEEIQQPFDLICCAFGTGATLAGIISALEPAQQALGFSVLKGSDFLREEVAHFLQHAHCTHADWQVETGYHFGGYARTRPALLQFMHQFERQFGITLDCVYTAKLFYGLFDLIRQQAFKPGTRIVAVHTGGLQGNAGFKDRLAAALAGPPAQKNRGTTD